MKKKEIIIIIIIVLITLGFAFSSTIMDLFKKEEIKEEKEERFILINFKGELLEEFSVKVEKGVTFAYLIQFVEIHKNSFSINDIDLNEKYYESKDIFIKTKDTKSIEDEEITIDLENKININNALQKELIKIYGIGDKRAARIIEYRKNKRIEEWSELKALIEVSDYVIEQIKKEAIL